MRKKMKRLLTVLCVLALAVTALPTVPAKAATIPKFKKTYASLYENGAANGKYTYTLQNLKKGQTVEWSVSGAGKAYVSVKKATKTAAKSTMKNIITVDTNGADAAKNKKVKLTAKIYSKAGVLQYTVTTTAKIRVKPTGVELTVPDEADDLLFVGESYDFGYTVTPSNATSTNVWTVTGSDGADYSSYMSNAGVFKPTQAGIYTIKLAAMIGTKTMKSAKTIVEVVDYMLSAEQTAADKLKLTYSGDVSDDLTESDFTVQTAAGAGIAVKSVAFSSDGTEAELTLYSNFKDGVSYSVSDGVTVKSFEASVGTPVSLEILTTQVTVGKESTIEYALYDKNGVDVTSVYETAGTVTYDAEVTNGYLTDANKLYMTTVGKTATITLVYTSSTDSSLILADTDVITCVAAVASADTNFTLTTASTAPDYTAASYADNRKAAIGTTYYAHFRALDTDGSEISYTSVSYESSDPDTMIITASGKVTPIKSGTVKVIVTAVYAGEEYTYSYEVVVAEAARLSKLELSETSVSMSNVYSTEYQKYIEVTALDQYGDSYALTDETASITDNSTVKASIATYDAANNRIILKASKVTAGTYSYTLTLTSGGYKATADFTVVVSAVPSSGTTTYELEIDKTSVDLSLTTDISGSQYVNVRLAQYRDGVFTNYTIFTSATVTKGSSYYTYDLTTGGTTTAQTLGASNRLSLKTLDITSGVCSKAATGTYTISLQYYSSTDKAYQTLTTTLTITDTQDTPTVTIDRVTATKSCNTALELAQNCLTVSNGTITECVVTGESEDGSKVTVAAGDQVNIKSVTIEASYTIADEQTVTVTYTVAVGKTLTNI